MIYSWFWGHWPMCNLDQVQFSVRLPSSTITVQGLAEYCPWIKSDHSHLFTYFLWLLSPTTYWRLGPETHKAENIYFPGFYRNHLLTLFSSLVPAHFHPLYSLTWGSPKLVRTQNESGFLRILWDKTTTLFWTLMWGENSLLLIHWYFGSLWPVAKPNPKWHTNFSYFPWLWAEPLL